MNTTKMTLISKTEMYKRVRINPDKLIKVLLALGNKYCHSVSKDKWSPKNPTRGYCYKLTEVVAFRLRKMRIAHHVYQIKTKSSNHWFIVLDNDSIIIDLMVQAKGTQYEKGVRRNFFPCNTKTNMSLGAEAIARGLGIL
ncbi:MAG: hypothetical protein ABSC53_03360 [Bacteroidota bacterium]